MEDKEAIVTILDDMWETLLPSCEQNKEDVTAMQSLMYQLEKNMLNFEQVKGRWMSHIARRKASEEKAKERAENNQTARAYWTKVNSNEQVNRFESLLSAISSNVRRYQRARVQFTAEETERLLKAEFSRVMAETSGNEVKWDKTTIAVVRMCAKWMSESNKPFLMLMGNLGTGKSTLMKAVVSLWNRCGLPYAKLVKATEVDYEDKDVAVLAVDDLGVEPKEVLDYGTRRTPMTDMLENRYDANQVTIIATNLLRDEYKERYGKRNADRVKDKYAIIDYGDACSYRGGGKR